MIVTLDLSIEVYLKHLCHAKLAQFLGIIGFMMSLLPSIFVLGLAAIVSVLLTRYRKIQASDQRGITKASLALAVATLVQAAHFSEEAFTGFHEKLPALFGLPPMSFTGLMVFNLAWLAIWVFSIYGLRAGFAFSMFAAWFLAIAGMINGIAHPLLTLASGEYFPGLYTSPIIFIAGIMLWRALKSATRPV